VINISEYKPEPWEENLFISLVKFKDDFTKCYKENISESDLLPYDDAARIIDVCIDMVSTVKLPPHEMIECTIDEIAKEKNVPSIQLRTKPIGEYEYTEDFLYETAAKCAEHAVTIGSKRERTLEYWKKRWEGIK